MPDKMAVLDAIRTVAKNLARPPSRTEFKMHSGMSEYQVLRHFTGWREAVKAAGLEADGTNIRLDDDTLLQDWGEIVRKNRQIPTRNQYRREGTVCNITDLPAPTRDLIAASLKGEGFLPAGQVQLHAALDYGGLAVLNDAWSRFHLDELFADLGSSRQRGLLQAILYSRLLFPCAKLSLAQQAQGTWLAQACGLDPQVGPTSIHFDSGQQFSLWLDKPDSAPDHGPMRSAS